jgi:DNA-directed RNA polymerase subunit H (RpoH/RPB5)
MGDYISEFNNYWKTSKTQFNTFENELYEKLTMLIEILVERQKAFHAKKIYNLPDWNSFLNDFLQKVINGEREFIYELNEFMYIYFEFVFENGEQPPAVKGKKNNIHDYKALIRKNYLQNDKGKYILIITNTTKKLESSENFIVLNLDEWEYNPCNHVSQPTYFVLNDNEKKTLLSQYNIKESQIPKIDTTNKELYDKTGKFLGFMSGDIVKITRKTWTNGFQDYFRLVK